MNLYKNKTKGFTLIELILYVSLASVMMLSISFFISVFLQVRIKNQVIAEVEQQGVQVVQMISQTIRNAQAINSPTVGNSATSLSLATVSAGLNPTVFDLSGNTIRMAEGGGSPVDLTSSRLVVSSLDFQNLSRANTKGIVRFQFTLTHLNPEGRNEYNYAKTFNASASLKSN